MALTGIQILKMLPKKNCGECGIPTCLAFAMKVAAGQTEIGECPYVSDEVKEQIGEASAPPIRTVKIGSGDSAYTTGGETCLFRHEKRFENPTGIAVLVTTDMSEADVDGRISRFKNLRYERVGVLLKADLIAIKDTKGEPLKAVVDRGGQTLTFTIVPKLVDGNWFIGIKSYGETRKERLGVADSAKAAALNTVVLPVMFAKGLYMTFSGKVKADDLAGPVGIVHIGSKIYSDRGMYDFLYFCGMLMAALFFFNLLPIPPLDGGHVLYLAIEKVRGKPISIRWKNRITIVFLTLLIVLSIYICGNDINRACTGFQLPQ